MITRRKFLGLLGAGGLLGSLGLAVTMLPGGRPASAFPAIRYGREQCSYCGMGIDDARYASAWRTSDGRERHFDDIGCLVNAVRRDQPASGTQLFVHDYRDESWLDATVASYAVAPAIKTPMAYGVAAAASPSALEGLAPVAAPALAWEQVLAQVERRNG